MSHFSLSFLFKRSFLLLVIFVLLIALFSRLRNIYSPLFDAHYFRQTQTATYAKNFYKEGIDLFHPKLDIIGLGPERVLVLEFPLFEAIVAMLSNILGFSDSIGRSVAIIFGLSGGVFLVLLTELLFDNHKISLYSLIFFLFAPVNIFFQQTFMIESMVVAFHLLSIYLWALYALKGYLFLLVSAAIVTVLALVQKSVYAPFLFIPILSVIYFNSERKKLISRRLILVLGLIILIFIGWVKYTDYANNLSGHGYFSSGNADQQLWNFGNLLDRFSPNIWKLRLNALFGNLTKFFIGSMLLTTLYFFINRPKKYLFALIWVLSAIIYYLIFFRIQSHDYYLLSAIPPLAVYAGLGIYFFQESLDKNLSKLKVSRLSSVILIVVFLSLFSIKGMRNSQPFFSLDSNIRRDTEIIRNSVKDGDFAVFIFPEYDWNSVWTYYTGLKGISTDLNKFQCSAREDYLKKGYKYIIITDIGAMKEKKNFCDLNSKEYKKILEERNIAIYKFI